MSKGSMQRPTDLTKYRENYERIFGNGATRAPQQPAPKPDANPAPTSGAPSTPTKGD